MAAPDFREYCVVMPLEPMRVGEWFDRALWPRHVTVCPEFRSRAADIDVLAAILRRAAATLSPPMAVVRADAWFGLHRNVPVQVVDSDDLHRLHNGIVAAFDGAARFEALVPDHHGDGYRPHVTVTGGSRLDPGSGLDLHALALVEIAPDGVQSFAVPVAIAQIGRPGHGETASA